MEFLLVSGGESPSAVQLAGDLLIPLWPLWALVGAIFVVRAAYRIYRLRRLSRSGIYEIDRMNGPEFELYLGTMFGRLGYRVEQVGSVRGDFGCDLLLRKDGRRIAVQAKRWRKSVGVKAVQEAVAAKAMYDCTDAAVATNSYFTEQARKLARANKVRLYDREELVRALLEAKKAPAEPGSAPSRQQATPSATAKAVSEPVAFCARCGRSVSRKVRAYCLSHAERFSGLIYCYEHQRDL
jgi:restriction system protein